MKLPRSGAHTESLPRTAPETRFLPGPGGPKERTQNSCETDHASFMAPPWISSRAIRKS